MDVRETLEMLSGLSKSEVLLRRAAKKYNGLTLVVTQEDELFTVFLGEEPNLHAGKSTTIAKALIEAIHVVEKSQDLHTL